MARTKGSGNLLQAWPLSELDHMCVGVVICVDINAGFGAFCWVVADRIRSSKRRWKFLCVPADMASHWFSGKSIGSEFVGMHAVVCVLVQREMECRGFFLGTTDRLTIGGFSRHRGLSSDEVGRAHG